MRSKLTAIVLFAIFLPFAIFSQVADKSYTDCDGNTESIYGIIGTGMPLLIGSKGYDCNICMSQAGKVQDFASQHPEVRVWGAMNYRYSVTTPACPALYNWRTTYSWNDIFMFNDVNDEWQGLSYPTYYVISPMDSTIAYQGSNFSSAEAKALSFVTTGIVPVKENNSLQVIPSGNVIQLYCFSNSCDGERTLSLVSLTGQTVFSEQFFISNGHSVNLSLPESVVNGIYLAKVSDQSGKSYLASKISVHR